MVPVLTSKPPGPVLAVPSRSHSYLLMVSLDSPALDCEPSKLMVSPTSATAGAPSSKSTCETVTMAVGGLSSLTVMVWVAVSLAPFVSVTWSLTVTGPAVE